MSKQFKFKKLEYKTCLTNTATSPSTMEDPFDEEDDSVLLAAMEDFETKEKGPVTSTPIKGSQSQEVYGNSVKGYTRPNRDHHVIETNTENIKKVVTPLPKAPAVSPIIASGSGSTDVQGALSKQDIVKLLSVLASTEEHTDERLINLATTEEIEKYLVDLQMKIDVVLVSRKLRLNGVKL